MIVGIFSGQGAQYEDMGRSLAQSAPAAAELYELCSTALGFDLLSLTADQLKETRYSQPATTVLSLAAYRAFVQAAGTTLEPQALAGFSLGEYAMLGAAGILDLKQLMDLLEHRSIYMQAACQEQPGAMYAVLGLDDETVAAVCAAQQPQGAVLPANYNCPGQLVISGSAEPAAKAAAALKEQGARRVIQLKVAGAFHTPLMAAAGASLRTYAAGLTFRPEAAAGRLLFSNIDGQPLRTDNLPAYLEAHMVSPVRWTDEVRSLIAAGATTFIEFGPGKTLCGLVRKIDRSCTVLNIEDADSLEATLKALDA